MTSILNSKGFRIKEWISSGHRSDSSKSCNQQKVQMLLQSNNHTEATEGVLGVRWQPNDDSIRFQASAPEPIKVVTKRVVLSTANKIFDPIGLLTPYTVKLKILMRQIWAHRPKIDWDDQIPPKLMENWQAIVHEISNLSDIRFPRSITPDNTEGKPKLIVFSDGSE